MKDPLSLCERCLNRSFDLKQGVVCGLTNEKPNFGDHCKDFKEDASQTMNIERKKKIEARIARNRIVYLICLLFLIITPIVMLYRACKPEQRRYSSDFGYYYACRAQKQKYTDIDINKPQLTPFEILEGDSLFEKGVVAATIETAPNYIRLNLTVELGDSVVYPKVYNQFGKLDEADYIRLYTKGRNEQGDRCLERITTTVSQFAGKSTFSFAFEPREFKNLRIGEHDIVLDIRSAFADFFGVDSKVCPFQFKVKFHYTAFPVYATKVYFKSMVLNRNYCDSLFNDWDPGLFAGGMDAGILIEANDEKVIYKYTNESYAVYGQASGMVYHKEKDIDFYVQVLDHDGSTADDKVNSTNISSTEMRSDDYINFVLEGTKSLWLRCDSTVVANPAKESKD